MQHNRKLIYISSLLAFLQFGSSTNGLAQTYDVNAIQQELTQLRARFNQCTSGFGAGMDQNFQNYLQGGGYGTTEMGQGCDMNSLAAINARAYELELQLARANGDTRDPCEIERVLGCPEPGQ